MLLNRVVNTKLATFARKSTKELSTILPQQIIIQSKRNFSRESIGQRSDKPWDYVRKDYGLWGQLTDSTIAHLTENSLIITVDGNFGAGKSEFAKKLAKEIDFVYASEVDLDKHMYTMVNGFNIREHINEITQGNEFYHMDTIEDWHTNPSFKRSARVQHAIYFTRWMQMRTALIHLFSTGQGVVLERSPWSDYVIAQSMYDNLMLSDEAWKFYRRSLNRLTIADLWTPHVSIYLDKSPEECLKSIKQNGKSFEKDSKAYSLKFLQSVDDNYKNEFLPSFGKQVHSLSYDSVDALKNVQNVIDDLELLDFDDENKNEEWKLHNERQLNVYRRKLSSLEHCLADILLATPGIIKVPELLLHTHKYHDLMEKLENDPNLTEAVNDASGKRKLQTGLGWF